MNRLGSPFNAGWWLAGLEQLVMSSDTASTILWVGGDASVRPFRKIPGTCTWIGDPLERVDSIVAVSSGAQCTGHTRREANALRVEFDAQGRHSRTVNRLSEVTRFVYGSGSRLDSIIVPSGTRAVAYVFGYSGSGALERVELPLPSPTGARVVQIQSRTGSLLAGSNRPRTDSIGFHDSTGVRFEFGGAAAVSGSGPYRVSGRRDRMGVLTSFTFDASQRLASSSVLANATDVIVHAFRVAEGQGRGTGAAGQAHVADSVYTRLDGPRGDVVDVSKWWLNSLGAPLRVRDPVGGEVRLRYSTTHPALVSEMEDAAGLRTLAKYTARGLLDSMIVHHPFTATNAVTTINWHASWEYPIEVKDPNGLIAYRSYDASTGNLLTARTGNSIEWDARFEYLPDGRLERAFAPGASVATEITYEPTLGNAVRTRTPGGAIVRLSLDVLGRDSVAVSSTDVVTDTILKVIRGETLYDIRGRVAQTRSWSAALPYTLTVAPTDTTPVYADTLVTTFSYDQESRPTRIKTVARPNFSSYDNCPPGTPQPCEGSPLRFDPSDDLRVYDRIGRLLSSSVGTGPRVRTYDLAGNPAVDSMRSGGVMRYKFDAANRASQRTVEARTHASAGCSGFTYGELHFLTGGTPTCWMIFPIFPNAGSAFVVPADTVRMTYDYAGGLARADNIHARISRGYYANGALRSDSTSIRSYLTSSFTTSVFGLQYTYDIGGRRTALSLPASQSDGQISYFYSSQRGLLDSVAQGETRAAYVYDAAGRDTLVKISRVVAGVPTLGVTERRRFDVEDNLVRRVRARGDGSIAMSDSMEYDARGKIRAAFVSSVVADVGAYTSRVWYTGHGAVLATEATRGGAWWEAEQFRVTALGQVFYRRADKGAVSSPYPQVSYFNSRGALTAKRPLRPGLPGDPFYVDTVYAATDSTGAVSRAGTHSYTSGAEVYTATRNYFGTDDRLVATQRYYSDDASGRSGSWDEFRYDALGRRVLTRTRRVAGDSVFALCSIECIGVVERTVWDGNQVLYEFRVDGGENRTVAQLDQLTSTGTHWGKAGYVQGPAIDQPIFLMGGRVPNYNWRGLVESSLRHDGTSDDCAIWPTAGCKNYGWPAGLSVYYQRFSWTASTPTPQWVGSLVRNSAGSTGVLYRRNRYYDPGSGQFTQADPIGLAGGPNLYGYAGSDPVNNFDPTGRVCQRRGSDLLVCNPVGSGDFNTIRTFLGGSAGHHAYEQLSAAFPDLVISSCGRKFKANQCEMLADAMSRLIVDVASHCRNVGVNAMTRLQNGRYRRGTWYSRADYGEAESAWPRSWNYVGINDHTFKERGQLDNTIAHEEFHILNWWRSERRAEAFGHSCEPIR